MALWNFKVRVIAFNIVSGHIHGRANAAVEVLSRRQTDPSQNLELQFLASNPLEQIERDMKNKTPGTSTLSMESSSV